MHKHETKRIENEITLTFDNKEIDDEFIETMLNSVDKALRIKWDKRPKQVYELSNDEALKSFLTKG